MTQCRLLQPHHLQSLHKTQSNDNSPFYAFATQQNWRRHCVLGCPVVLFIHQFIFPFIQSNSVTMNGFNNFDKTDSEYSIVPTDDLIRF